MTTLLLFSLPWGYLISGIFLLLAIILFVVAIFMKDTRENYDEGLETRRYNQQPKDNYEGSYENTFDRYQDVTENEVTEDTLQDMIAETSEDLAETRKFTPIVDIPEPTPYEEPIQYAEPEPYTEPVQYEQSVPYEAPVTTFAEPEEVVEEVPAEVFEEVAAEPEMAQEEIAEEIPVVAPMENAQAAAPVEEEDEFDEIRPKKRRFSRDVEDDEMEVPKPVAKQKSGMSFAEEVRRLIEEEEKKKK